MADTMENALKVKRKNEKKWLRLKGVVAVGIGKIGDETGIIISVETNYDIPNVKIPSIVAGVPTKIQAVGRIEAL